MCLITFNKDADRPYPFVLIANRDESYHRESKAIHFWEDEPNIIGGRDMKAGGTWLAMTKTGRFAALTNQPFTKHEPVELTSRGELISNFLKGDMTAIEYAKELRTNRLNYDGYNLLFGTLDDLYLYDNVSDALTPLSDGIHSVSNTKDDLSKYRQTQSESDLTQMLEANQAPSVDQMIKSFQDKTPNPDFKHYPEHLDKEYARQSSSIFLSGNQEFGTVSTTAIVVDKEGKVQMKEVRYNPEEITQVTEETFQLESE